MNFIVIDNIFGAYLTNSGWTGFGKTCANFTARQVKRSRVAFISQDLAVWSRPVNVHVTRL